MHLENLHFEHVTCHCLNDSYFKRYSWMTWDSGRPQRRYFVPVNLDFKLNWMKWGRVNTISLEMKKLNWRRIPAFVLNIRLNTESISTHQLLVIVDTLHSYSLLYQYWWCHHLQEVCHLVFHVPQHYLQRYKQISGTLCNSVVMDMHHSRYISWIQKYRFHQ